MKKLQEAESKMQQLLNELQELDKQLSGCTPADPARSELKAKKNELLPRYRGAKQHVKDLRRIASASGPATSQDGTNKNELLEGAYDLIAHLWDLYNSDQLNLEREDANRIDAWLEKYDARANGTS